jgi:hypothetical protein
MYTTRFSFYFLMKLEFSRQTLDKSSNIKFHKIRPLRVELLQCSRRRDRHDDANSRFS